MCYCVCGSVVQRHEQKERWFKGQLVKDMVAEVLYELCRHNFKQAVYIKHVHIARQDCQYWTSVQNPELCSFVFPKTSNSIISTISAQVWWFGKDCASS